MHRVAKKHELELPAPLVEGTIKGVPGAAASLLEHLYEQLTGKKYAVQLLLTAATKHTMPVQPLIPSLA